MLIYPATGGLLPTDSCFVSLRSVSKCNLFASADFNTFQHKPASAKDIHAVAASTTRLTNAFSSHLCMCMAADGFGLRLLEAGEVCQEVGEDTLCTLPAVGAQGELCMRRGAIKRAIEYVSWDV